MMKPENIVFGFLVVILCLTTAAKFYKYYVVRDYSLLTTISCDPVTEQCFVEDCTGEECDATPYKYIEKNAQYFSSCNPYIEECSEETCSGEEECSVTECSELTLSEGELCYNQ